MKLGEFKKKADKVKGSSNRTIQLTPNPKTIGIQEKDLSAALEPILSRLVSSENASKSAFARTEDFQNELLEVHRKLNSQNIELSRFEKLNSSLVEDNLRLKKKVEILTSLVENGPLLSPGAMNSNKESNGIVSNMKNLGTVEMPLFSMEISNNGK